MHTRNYVVPLKLQNKQRLCFVIEYQTELTLQDCSSFILFVHCKIRYITKSNESNSSLTSTCNLFFRS